MKNYLDFEGLSYFLNQLFSKFATISDLSNKVDKVDGKGLSTNDFTTEEKEKLASINIGINNGDQVNVQADWNQSDETATDYVKNRTHYEEYVVAVPETTVQYIRPTTGHHAMIAISGYDKHFVVGKMYTVTWNGETHTSVCQEDKYGDGFNVLGNHHLWADNFDNTGEPYFIYANGSSLLIAAENDMEVTFSITETELTIHKLPNEYLDIFSDNENTVEILREHTSELQDPEGGSGGIFATFASIPEDGQICVVTWNGTKYECVAEEMNVEGLSIIGLGNTSAFGGNQTTEHPFLIGVVMPEYISLTGGMTAAILALDGSTTITISIQGECKKLILNIFQNERTGRKKENFTTSQKL